MATTGAFHTEGGTAVLNRLMIRSMTESGYQAEIFALAERDETIDKRYAEPSLVGYRVFGGNKIRFSASVLQALLTNDYDYVLSDHVHLASILALPSKLGRCRYAVWLCGVEVFPPKPGFEGRLGIASAWKRIAISRHTQKRVLETFPHLPVEICELALDPGRYPTELLSETAFYQPELYMMAVDGCQHRLQSYVVLAVGRMADSERYKGQDVLLEAFPQILEIFPDAQLILVGQGDDAPRLRSLATAQPKAVQARIFMPGFVQDELLSDLYKSCCLFAMPSWGEGFGLVYLEAMAHGKPCLGGRLDAAPDLIQDGITGLIVDDPKSPKKVADSICWLFSHPEQARQMGLAGYHRVRSNYLFPHFKERFLRLLGE